MKSMNFKLLIYIKSQQCVNVYWFINICVQHVGRILRVNCNKSLLVRSLQPIVFIFSRIEREKVERRER